MNYNPDAWQLIAKYNIGSKKNSEYLDY